MPNTASVKMQYFSEVRLAKSSELEPRSVKSLGQARTLGVLVEGCSNLVDQGVAVELTGLR